MPTTSRRAFQRFRPDDLLGPLNVVERKNAPEWLYVAGDCDLLRVVPRVSIVGTRGASPAGLRRAARLARELVDHGVVVVSGLGIDTAAHRSAIEAGGRTIAVLGTPLDQTYPRENTLRCLSFRRATLRVGPTSRAATEPWPCSPTPL